MRAVDRTTRLFVQSLDGALPGVQRQISRSRTVAGRSNYVYIFMSHRSFKVRISDHPIGMRRALSGEEDLYIAAGRPPSSWAVWLGDLVSAGRAARNAREPSGRSSGRGNALVAP